MAVELVCSIIIRKSFLNFKTKFDRFGAVTEMRTARNKNGPLNSYSRDVHYSIRRFGKNKKNSEIGKNEQFMKMQKQNEILWTCIDRPLSGPRK